MAMSTIKFQFELQNGKRRLPFDWYCRVYREVELEVDIFKLLAQLSGDTLMNVNGDAEEAYLYSSTKWTEYIGFVNFVFIY